MTKPSSGNNHDDKQDDAVKDEKKQQARKVIEEWSQEQERKKNIGISVSEAMRLHNQDVAVRGVIVSISALFKMIKQRTSICRNDLCNNKLEIKIFEQPQFTDYQKKYGNVCPACNSSESPKIQYDYITVVAIKIQDDEPYGELEQLDCLLFGRDTLNVHPGEIVQAKGHIEVDRRKDRLHPVLHTQSIKYERRDEPEITSKNIESFHKFAKMSNVIDRLISMFAPNVIGHKNQKLGILRSVVGAPETSKLRGRINTLLIGPTGVAKSMLTREAVEQVPNSRYVTAQNASGKGVTAIIDKENETTVLRLGAVPQARGAVCAINEIGRMDYVDQSFLLDVMEEGEFTVDKYGIHVKIKSPTTIIATANPNGTTWNTNYHMSNSEIPVLNTLRDRFDQIFGISEFLSMEENREYAEKKAALDAKNIHHNYNYLKMYFAYASTLSPEITPEAQSMLVEFWLELKGKELATNRTLDSLFRLAKAQARMHLSDVVDPEIATEVMHSYSNAMLQYGQIIKIIESPRDVTYREMLSIIKSTKAPVELAEAARMACERNEQVRSYLGPRLDLKHNWKLKAVRDMLVNNQSIKQVNDKPIVLQWFEDRPNSLELGQYTKIESRMSEKNAEVCDVSEVCDDLSASPQLSTNSEIENNEEERTKSLSMDAVTWPSQEQKVKARNMITKNNEDTSLTSHASLGLDGQILTDEVKARERSKTSHQNEGLFQCFYCNEDPSSDQERAIHIDNTHPGKLHYPTPEDFDTRLKPNK